MRLIYCPVSTDTRHLVNHYHPHCLFNPIRQMPKLLKPSVNVEYFADSGGYQLYRYNGNGTKRCLVVPAVGIKGGQDLLVIDPRDLCKRYGKLGVKYGFTLDHPLSDEPSKCEFIHNLTKSYRWANYMFQHRSRWCPHTEFLVPLHYSTRDELHQYYDKMSQLSPDGYAFPVRGSFDFYWIIRIACTLSFLYSKGVQKVHMFGSSRKEVIVIGAAAIGIGMFEQVSFDSRTWNTLLFDKRPKYFDPYTLKGKRIQNEKVIEILLPSQLLQTDQYSAVNLNKTQRERLLMLHNAMAISHYAEYMANRAEELNRFKEYLNAQRYLASKKDRLLIAINILEETVSSGYEFVQRWLKWIWK